MGQDSFLSLTEDITVMQEPGEQKMELCNSQRTENQHRMLLRQNPEIEIGVWRQSDVVWSGGTAFE